jgi:flagellar hook-associated protein 3 FlgL
MSLRITDQVLSNNYLSSINKIKNKISKLNEDIVTGEKIHSPSDSPTGVAKLLSLNKRYSACETYISNIAEADSFITESITAMESIQTEITTAITTLTEISDATEESAIQSYAEKIDSILQSIVSSANTESGGKYLFGGTDFSGEPYVLSSDGNSVSLGVDNTSGSTKVQITSNTEVTINTSGADLFDTIVKQSGNIDSSTAIGGTVTTQTTVYDGSGDAYTLNLTYTKTAADTYDLTYTVDDSSGATVYTSASASSLKFDPTSGKLLTVDGKQNTSLNISIPNNNITFTLNMADVKETASASSFTYSANQKRDIFSTLISIRNSLSNGTVPSDEDLQVVEDFNDHVLDEIAKAGNTQNQLETTKELIQNRETTLSELITKENGIDETKAILDLENQQYLLQLAYEAAASILPQSLLDYL